MNWDWEKLQEKRQRQPHVFRPDFRNGGDTGGGQPPSDSGKQPTDPLRALRGMGAPNGRQLLWIIGGIVLLWLLSGIYIVEPQEQGIVLRFGEYVRSVEAGPHYHLPFPIETVYKPEVTRVLRSEVGFRSMGQDKTFQQGRIQPRTEEASMLTGDENIVNVQFSVQYKMKDAVQYLFNVANPHDTVRNAAEAAMREIIGKSLIDSALTDGKLKIQNDATELLQSILDRYEVGIQVLAVQLQDVHPPQEVIDAFKDVASAREDKSRIINEAEAYRNEILPVARGKAAEMVNTAEAYRATRVQTAEGGAQRFLSVLAEYEKAKDVTKKRLYFEAVEDILNNAGEKIILPGGAVDRVLPFLPVDRGPRPTAGNAAGRQGSK